MLKTRKIGGRLPHTRQRIHTGVSLGRLMFIFAVITLSLLGCAYYNTFYNAKKQFRSAEKSLAKNAPGTAITSSQRDLYEQAIKKASKVLTFHPNSKYVDDALFMMGKAYFRMEELGKARRKFEELLANYPHSKFRWEAYYLLGAVLYYMGDIPKARDALSAVIDPVKKSSWADDAHFLMGEIALDIGDYQLAVKEYSKVAEDYPNSELRSEAMFVIGESHFKLKNYREALTAFQEASRYELVGPRRYEIELRIGECYQQLNEYQKALETFQRLASSDRYVDHLPEIRLRISEVYFLTGDTSRAIQEYHDIIKIAPKTKEAAWAYYQLGLIHMNSFDDMVKAKEYFDKSSSESSQSEAAILASLRRNQIKKLEEYQNKVAIPDSLQDSEARFALAEVYLLDVNWPDSALVYYQSVVELTPLSKYAPRSAYAAAWIVENVLGDTARSREMFQALISTYPSSPSAHTARERLGQPAAVDSSMQDVAERFREAEDLLLKGNDVDGALALYNQIVTDFPHSPYAPKAKCALAWTLEYFKGDPDSAMAIFKQLAQEHPNSECALLAQRKVASLSTEAPEDTAAVLSVDTTTVASTDTTEQAPAMEEPEKVESETPEEEDAEPDKEELEFDEPGGIPIKEQ